MSPQLNIQTNESSGGGGVPTGTGTAFVAGTTDAGPPTTGPAYVRCESLTDFVNAFGPRSATSATAYDWLDSFFHDNGGQSVAYVTRVTDNTATSATLTLQDGLASPKPTVVVTAATPGTEGNQTFVTVAAGTSATFTATTTSSSTSITAVSSFKNIAVGTKVTGSGIPTGTYIASVTPGSSTATLSQAATASASGVVITPGTFTITVSAQDASGNHIADETHGPYYSTAQLFADTTSSWVTFSQSAGSGFTQNIPAALTATALAGGADANDLTDSSHVGALANFPLSLGPGTVVLPGKTTSTAWQGIRDHVNANNRWGVLDMTDSASSSGVISQVSSLAAGDWSRCFFIQGTEVIPGAPGTPTVARTVAGSAKVAALAAQVAASSNQAQAPAGQKWPLTYTQSFTEFYGLGGNYTAADVQAMEAVGVNCFANLYGTLCLYGFATPVPSSQELVYDQASAARERMALSNDLRIAMSPYLFDNINLATIEQMTTDLNGVGLAHYNGGALFDGETGQASQAFVVSTAAPINTPATAQAKQLNAQITVRIVRYADTVNITETVIPVSVGLPAAA